MWGDMLIDQAGYVVLVMVALVAYLAPAPVHEAFDIWRASRLPRPPSIPSPEAPASASADTLPAATDALRLPARSRGDSGRSLRLVVSRGPCWYAPFKDVRH